MFIRRHRKSVPQLNTASVADISFMLLILFLVVTSMDDDNGMSRMLPPLATEQQPTAMSQRNVLRILVSPNNDITINDDTVSVETLRERVVEFVDNPNNDPNLPEKVATEIALLGTVDVSKGVISLRNDRGTSYDMYLQVQNELTAAIKEMRDDLSTAHFGKKFADITEQQREAIEQAIPVAISEAEPTKIGGK